MARHPSLSVGGQTFAWRVSAKALAKADNLRGPNVAELSPGSVRYRTMKRVITIVSLATVLLAGSAIAQSPTPPAQDAPKEAPIPNRSIKLTAEQSYIIKENLIPGGKTATTGSSANSNGKIEIGGKAPSGAALQDFPQIVNEKVPAVKNYKFMLAGNEVVIVDPKDNTIADILK